MNWQAYDVERINKNKGGGEGRTLSTPAEGFTFSLATTRATGCAEVKQVAGHCTSIE